MDPKLAIPEILEIAFSHLAPSNLPQSSHSRSDLAALARTCKTFCGPALDVLWRSQTSLTPILSCFPEDLWDREDDPGQITNYQTIKQALRRPVAPGDWDRPSFYLSRIRSLTIFSFPPSVFAPGIFGILRLTCPNSSFFPNLRRLN
ncbi:hypothetical protein B0H15DRAFT_783708, partial [Mycena belliarum]